MKTNPRSFPVLLLTLVAAGQFLLTGSSHAEPRLRHLSVVPIDPRISDLLRPIPVPPDPYAPREYRSDYPAHLAHDYRMGYFAGRQDRAWGYDRNYRRAYSFSGCGWESYFQEGYADGYEGRRMSH